MKLNLPECFERVFDSKTGKIICKMDDIIKLVEDCIACNLRDKTCFPIKNFTKGEVDLIINKYNKQLAKIKLQRDIFLFTTCFSLLCWLISIVVSK